ncbi:MULTISPECIES: response regulator [unclassified Bradyrhizobium]|uniref:response regulator n=2 Tax=Bradyrhizobium TaxID=374 RepID=UPI0028F168D4|nr:MULTISPECIES: response regulator [unclassified Bradyrhizobium]
MSRVRLTRKTVLVVEDEGLIRANAVDMIRDLGFEVIEAADADQAISLLERCDRISVVFTDVQMPGSMDGLRLVAVIRDRWPPVALLVTSGQVTPSELPSGARFLAKPYGAEQLRSHLEALA